MASFPPWVLTAEVKRGGGLVGEFPGRPDLLRTEAGLLDGLSPGDRTTLAGLLAALAASLEHPQDQCDDEE